ncbi:hypothetical protein AAFF_G00237350 [Aldrovandia affinis]|uniref:Interleukin-12 subunit alpha n=1 Tax=Aldrovandia affinis TaxID=143900 RepID=A0AAD7REN1_9TELE|nr:hypothetical protein AAFF_G00237350 [Aldrovandia affinis]
MLQNVKLCFAPWLLALSVALACHLCDVSVGSPVTAPARRDALNMEHCVSHARALLWNVTDALTQDDNLFSGFNCTEQSLEVNTQTRTVSACEPNPRQGASCPGLRDTSFDKSECLKNVRQDLQYYRSVFLAYVDHPLGSTLVKTIDDLTQHCFTSSAPEDFSMTEVLPVSGNTFKERLHLCKVLKGFRVRTITINRIMSYIAAGDYKV